MMSQAVDIAPAAGVGTARRELTVQSGLAPLVYNAWYVIADSRNVRDELSSITVLGEPLVFFRTPDGTPVVLDDRCAHRRYSLARGRLKGDKVQCAYHGFTFDRTGACVFAPGVVNDVRFGVRSYPCVESGPWLWVWLGQPDRVDRTAVPAPPLVDESWGFVSGYTLNACNYVLVHENLLDLTHLHYLHGIADETYATTPPVALESDDGSVGNAKDVPATRFGIRGAWSGSDPATIVHRSEQIWCKGPSYSYAALSYVGADGTPVVPSQSVIEHAITPETFDSTHQFWCIYQNAPVLVSEEEAVAQVEGVFAEDQDVLALQHRYIREDRRTGVVENSIPSDVFGLRARRLMQRLSNAEKA